MKYKLRRYYIYYAAKVLFFFIRLIPRNISLAMADWLGKMVFWMLAKYRKLAVSNLEYALNIKHEEAMRIAENVFRNLAKNGADWIQFTILPKKRIASLVSEVQGLEYLDRAMAEAKGVVMAASHFGNWEVLSIYLRMNKYPGATIARRIYFHKYDKFITRMRRRFDIDVIYRDESPKRMIRLLKEGGILGIVADQDIDSVEGVFVNFFGKSTFTPTAPAKFAMATGASIIPAFIIRKPDNTYKLVFEEAVPVLSSGNKEEDVMRCTQAWTNILERYVREYPEQWVWLHARWKTTKI